MFIYYSGMLKMFTSYLLKLTNLDWLEYYMNQLDSFSLIYDTKVF